MFSLNGLFHFISQVPPSSQLGLKYLTVLSTSNYFLVVFLIELVAGLLLLANCYVALALTLLAPILVNIMPYHVFMEPAKVAPSVFPTILWVLLFVRERAVFRGLFQVSTPALS